MAFNFQRPAIETPPHTWRKQDRVAIFDPLVGNTSTYVEKTFLYAQSTARR